MSKNEKRGSDEEMTCTLHKCDMLRTADTYIRWNFISHFSLHWGSWFLHSKRMTPCRCTHTTGCFVSHILINGHLVCMHLSNFNMRFFLCYRQVAHVVNCCVALAGYGNDLLSNVTWLHWGYWSLQWSVRWHVHGVWIHSLHTAIRKFYGVLYRILLKWDVKRH